jgi:O-antigen/teichoic acid export membrane protein
VVNGATAYGFLILSARALQPGDYSSLSVLWALAFTIGPGLFFPLEQELARVFAARAEHGLGASGVLRQTAVVGGLLSLCLVAVTFLARDVLLDRLFAGHGVLLLALAISFVSFCALHLTRGVLSGTNRFLPYGLVAAGDGVARLGACALLFWTGVREPGLYGLGLTVAPLVALVALAPGRSSTKRGPSVTWSDLGEQVGFLMAGSLLSQFLVNLGPVAVRILAHEAENEAAGRFLASVIITRVPLFVFFAVQATLLPRLAALASLAKTTEFRATVRRLVLALVGVGVAGVGAAHVIGPFAVRTLFGPGYDLPARDMAMLAAGSAAFILALAMASALIALRAPALVALAWLAGDLAYIGVIALGSELFFRVEVGFLVGSVAAAAVMAVLLRARFNSPAKLVAALGRAAASTTPPVVIEP